MKKLLVILLVLGLAAPAMAAEVGFYGSFRTQLGYYDASENYGFGTSLSAVNGPAMDPTIFPQLSPATSNEGGFDDQGTLLSMSHQSRFGAKAKVTDSLNAVFEMGLRETNRSSTVATASGFTASAQQEAVYLRLAYGTWNFGSGALTVGKDYTPGTFLLYSNMIGDIGDGSDAVLLVAGLPYIGRQPQIKLTFGGFQFALIEANTGSFTSPTPTVTGYSSDVDFLLPRMEAAYQFNTPMFSLRPVVGYQTYDVVNRGATETDKSIDSYLAGLGVQLRLGAFSVNATGSYMINAGNYGQSNIILNNRTYATTLTNAGIFNDEIQDSTLMQATLSLGFKISPMLKVEVGGSYNNVERDLSPTVTAKQTGYLYYGQLPITLAPGVSIIPEIGYMDRGDLKGVYPGFDQDAGTLNYYCANFRIDF